MSQKFQRPSGTYSGQAGLNNRSKYIEDANASPKRPISSAKVDGDFNYLIDAVNQLDDASGSRGSISERLDVSLNADGTLKVSVAGALDEWIVHQNTGAIARVDNSTFSLAGGDFTAIYKPNRRVQMMVGGVALVADVASCSYAGGVTTVSVVDILTPAGELGVISSAPTQVGYGPLTPGVRGNTPRRTEGFSLVAGANTFAFGNEAGDMAIRRNGSVVARVGAGGLSGFNTGSVELTHLVEAVAEALNPVGSLIPFAGATVPAGWLLCYGQLVSRTTYANLFSVIGTTYGAGDGSTTFAVPDLRGRTLFGLDNMGGTAASRITAAVCGLQSTSLGAVGGHQNMHWHTHTVTDTGHSHALFSNSDLGNTGAPGATDAVAKQAVFGAYENYSMKKDTTYAATVGKSSTSTTGISIASSGGGNSQNIPPAMVMNWLIKA